MDTLNNNDESRIQAEYKKNTSLNRNLVDEIQDWLRTQPHLPGVSELETIQFLHANYYDTEGTKNTIECYYTSRAHYKEIFTNMDVMAQSFKHAQESMWVGVKLAA